jgi:hypothetical protein
MVTVKQKKDEDPQTFVDTVRMLAKKTLAVSHIPAVQDAYNTECEKRQLSALSLDYVRISLCK